MIIETLLVTYFWVGILLAISNRELKFAYHCGLYSFWELLGTTVLYIISAPVAEFWIRYKKSNKGIK